MERVTNIIDNYFLDAYDEVQLEDLYEKHQQIMDDVKLEMIEEIESVKSIENKKKRAAALTKLSKKIQKEVLKRRKPIQKDALAISKGTGARKSKNAKRQGKLIWD